MAMNVCYRDEYLVRAQWQAADKTCILPSPPSNESNVPVYLHTLHNMRPRDDIPAGGYR